MEGETELDTVELLRTLICSELDLPIEANDITSATKLFDEGLGLDSFAVVELITLLEARFDFQFAEADLRPERFEDVGTLAALIDERVEQTS